MNGLGKRITNSAIYGGERNETNAGLQPNLIKKPALSGLLVG